ncbi:MAG: hypothetical protein Q8L56_01590 [Rhodocyclaceae bacterium]|nr:hypothetical protein [Rhodocyclaceae bacterium]
MNKFGLLAYATNFAPWLLQVRRTTWVAVGAGLLVLFGLLIWAAVALIGGLWGQAQNLAGIAPEAVRGATRGALEQVDVIVPGAREKLGEFVPALKPETQPQRDVSGMELGPVARYPGLTRTHWQRTGGQAAAEYEGKADYAAVLDHYAKGFAAQGFAQSVQSATPQAEAHEYTKGHERFVLKITQKPKGGVSVRIETTLA